MPESTPIFFTESHSLFTLLQGLLEDILLPQETSTAIPIYQTALSSMQVVDDEPETRLHMISPVALLPKGIYILIYYCIAKASTHSLYSHGFI